MPEDHQDNNNLNEEDDNLHEARPLTGLYEDWFLEYASYVILERAIPNYDDGLKPVQRRILHAMKEMDDGRFHKVANIIGQTMQFHPHGDGAIYNAMVRMAQDWSLRDVLVDGQGNFGSVDGDPPASFRYTEVRLKKIARMLMDDVWNKTVDFQGTYDNSSKEPTVLPAKFPNLLVN